MNNKELDAMHAEDRKRMNVKFEQRLELSHDLSTMWNNYQARPDLIWLKTSFGLVRFSKAGMHVEVGESLGHQVREITNKEYSLMVQEYPELERVLLGPE